MYATDYPILLCHPNGCPGHVFLGFRDRDCLDEKNIPRKIHRRRQVRTAAGCYQTEAPKASARNFHLPALQRLLPVYSHFFVGAPTFRSRSGSNGTHGDLRHTRLFTCLGALSHSSDERREIVQYKGTVIYIYMVCSCLLVCTQRVEDVGAKKKNRWYGGKGGS